MTEDHFVMESGELGRPGEPEPILSLRDLLVVLGVHGGSGSPQREAVAAWLVDRKPEPLLRAALDRAGYLPTEHRRAVG
jgi:hypothetical protein